jgi:inosine-uridine nucleoside N-ribohydrolase
MTSTDESGTRSKPTIILDCDPGHDDAMALVLASQFTDLVGVTTVAGNAPLQMTTTNALAIAELFGIEAPIAAGADRPLIVDPVHAPQIHGTTGLGGTNLPRPSRSPDPRNAVQLLLDASRTHENLWVVAVGPLTNIALALRVDPTLAQRLAGVSIMGGSIGVGNVTPAAEFNLYFDPHAARMVFESGLPLQMCGLDLTHQFKVGPDVGERLRERALSGNDRTQARAETRAAFVHDALTYFAERYAAVSGGEPAGPMHDPCAVLALTHPELFGSEPLEVHVETEGENRGMTVADLRRFPGVAQPNVLVHRSIRAEDALTCLTEAMDAAIAR